jgi:hypothetical protein
MKSVIDSLPTATLPFTFHLISIAWIRAFAPGTGTPEPGGLTSNQALTLVEEFVSRVPNLVGMDVVEVAPAYDHVPELTTNIASTVLSTYMCGIIATSPEMQKLQVPPDA